MKTLTCLIPLSLLLCAGCATQTARTAGVQPFDEGLDMQKIARVERAAKAQNVDVRWVNPPRRKS